MTKLVLSVKIGLILKQTLQLKLELIMQQHPTLSLGDLAVGQKFIFLTLAGLNQTQYLICESIAEFEVIKHGDRNHTTAKNISSGEESFFHKELPVAPKIIFGEFLSKESNQQT